MTSDKQAALGAGRRTPLPEWWKRCPHGAPVPSGDRMSEWIDRRPVCAGEEQMRLAGREALSASNGGEPLPSRYPAGQAPDPPSRPGARLAAGGR